MTFFIGGTKMTYKTDSFITYIKRDIGECSFTYRLMSSGSERGGNFILLTSEHDGTVEDAFVPYVSESYTEAETVFRFLYENEVTPSTVFEILDDYFAMK